MFKLYSVPYSSVITDIQKNCFYTKQKNKTTCPKYCVQITLHLYNILELKK